MLLQPVTLAAQTRPAEPAVTAQDLPRVPATEAKDALQTFQVRSEFTLELAAAEPEVIDPIAMCFDERGRLFVVEMRDYSERREEKLSRIRMLEDRDNDGRYEKSTVFLDNLAWATAVMWVNGGVLVGATPDILFAKDTDGDGVADETQVLFTGFGNTQERLNVQGLFNNFNWGLDNRIHGCSGLNGGLVEQKLHPDRPPLDVRGKGFVIDPRDWSMTTENGGGQYGLSFDPWGRLYTCSNSSHIETFMYDARYAARNPHYAMPNPRVMIAADGPAAEVYRISPEEPWRVIRTRWRIAGLSKGVIEGGGRSAGYFTGATGITIYRGNAYGPEYVGDAFVGDAGGNLVHHKRIRRSERDALELVAERPADEKKIEFVASTDNWFRPVDFTNAPDGTLYIADMYRETIEHPWSIPPSIKQFLDLNSGNDRGRVYRIVPENFQRPDPPRLDQADAAELVAMLEHPNGWHRETAQRLLYERQDKGAVAPLVALLQTSTSTFARLHALHALDGLDALKESHVLAAMDDNEPFVRAHAVALAEKFMPVGKPSAALWEKLRSLASDPSADVRYQLAFTLGEVKHAERTNVLAQIAKGDLTRRWMQGAVMSSIGDDAGEMFVALRDLDATGAGGDLLRQLARQVAATGDAKHVERIAAALKSMDGSPRFIIAGGLVEGAAASDTLDQVRPQLSDLFRTAREMAEQTDTAAAERIAAVSFLAYADESVALPALLAALDDARSQQVQLAALAGLDRLSSNDVPKEILRRWSTMRPRVKSEAADVLIKRRGRAMALLLAMRQGGPVAASDLNSIQKRFLLTHANEDVKALANQVLSAPTATREAVMETFRPALSLTGDPKRGHAVYQKLCISCHRLGDEGFELGPDLTTVRNAGREKLLMNILDPSREVQPNFLAYQIDTTDGDSVLGVLVSDTPAGITLRQAYGKETTIRRDKIKKMSSDGRSIMPDGLEAGMTPQDMADLLTFIERVTPSPSTPAAHPREGDFDP
ncbi:MAG TPA: PVC-type heme-binding CxxCH protein [Tepidisphaeraceae bacterium]|nr:PVC-type heme-binding CxxCH protein [Tepidisphaeraceae bacterium]